MCLTPYNRSVWAFVRRSTSEDDQLATPLVSEKHVRAAFHQVQLIQSLGIASLVHQDKVPKGLNRRPMYVRWSMRNDVFYVQGETNTKIYLMSSEEEDVDIG